MAYTPTLADIPQEGAYTPTLADLPPDTHSMGQSIENNLGGLWNEVKQGVSYPAAAISGIGQGTRDILNIPSSLTNLAARHLVGHNVVPNLPQVESLSQMTGGWLQPHSIVRNVAKFIPAMVGGEAAMPELMGMGGGADAAADSSSILSKLISPNLANQMGSGALYGASQDQSNPLEGAAENALLSGAVGKGMEGLSALGKPISRYLAGKVVDPMVAKAGALMQQDLPSQTGANALGNARQAVANNVNYEGLTPLAQQADQTTSFENQGFLSKLQSMKDNMAQEYKANPKGTEPLMTAIQDEIDNPPTSFEDALNKNKAYNDLPSTWETTNNSMSRRMRGIASQMKTALNNSVQDNASQSPEAQNFLNEWNNQKANYANLQKFNQLPVGYTKNGGLSLAYSNPLAKEMQPGGIPSDDVMSQFLPKASQDSTMKMEHFSNLIGNQPVAQQILKQNVMQPAIESGTFDPNKAMQIYQKLSPDQRNWLFNDNENNLMGSALQAQKLGGSSKLSQLMAKHANQGALSLLGGLAGASMGYEHGENPLMGGLTGAAAGYGAPMLADYVASRFASPAGVKNLLSGAASGANLHEIPLVAQALANPMYSSLFGGHK